MAAEITLVDADGRTCVVGTPEEANNLLAEGGYRIQQPARARPLRPRPEQPVEVEK